MIFVTLTTNNMKNTTNPDRIVYKTRGNTRIHYLTWEGDFDFNWGDIAVQPMGDIKTPGEVFRLVDSRSEGMGSTYAQPLRKEGYLGIIEQDEEGENILVWIKQLTRG